MTFEYDNKGKIFTDVVSKTPVEVLVQTTTHLIKGMIHVHKEERLKDGLDNESTFFALTEASILDSEGKILYKNDFVAIQKKQIVWVIPESYEENNESVL